MKHLFVFFLAGMALVVQAQQELPFTLYGFSQKVSPGIEAAGDINEDGKLIKKKSSPLFNYTIFVSVDSNETLLPAQLWIMGKPFAVRVDTLEKAPLVYITNGRYATKKQTLLPPTNGIWMRFWPEDIGNVKEDVRAKRHAKTNELVVVYETKSGVHYGVLKKFSLLRQGILQ